MNIVRATIAAVATALILAPAALADDPNLPSVPEPPCGSLDHPQSCGPLILPPPGGWTTPRNGFGGGVAMNPDGDCSFSEAFARGGIGC
jgi:hypothetical protein